MVGNMGRKALKGSLALSHAVGEVIRESLPCSQREFAELLGVSHDTLQRWLGGFTPIGLEQLPRIGTLLGLKPSELVRRGEERLLKTAMMQGETRKL